MCRSNFFTIFKLSLQELVESFSEKLKQETRIQSKGLGIVNIAI